MYNFFALIIGGMLATMIYFNVTLANSSGMLLSTLIINLVGLLSAIIFVSFSKEKKMVLKNIPLYFFLGGIFSIFVVLSNNFCLPILGISLNTALSLLGQSVTSSLIDNFGLFGLEKIPFNKNKFPGFLLVLIGIITYIFAKGTSNNSCSGLLMSAAIFTCLLTGALIVISLVVNSNLANRIGILHSSLINYIIAFSCLVIICIFTPKFSLTGNLHILKGIPFWTYLGGLFGVLIIALSNIVVPKIPVVYATLFMFIGQLYTSMVLEFISDGNFSTTKLLAGILITIGMIFNLYIDKIKWIKN
ncbi:hypothetical protein C3495_13295 [Clostridiaceae bacterium 14S0207]|nr:hypothetical protein C3495_13295 [Clostridiaceae bacterium 14S0207]